MIEDATHSTRPTRSGHPHAGQRRSVDGVLPVGPAAAYLLISDVVTNAEHSPETLDLQWEQREHPDGVTVGDRFTAHNALDGTRWTSTSIVTAAEPGHRFSFAVSGTEHPTATWTFELEPAPDGRTRVTYSVVLGDGPSMFDAFAGPDLTHRQTAVARRLDQLAENMRELLLVLARPHHPADGPP